MNKPHNKSDIKNRINMLIARQEMCDAKIDLYNLRIKSLSDKKIKSQEEIVSLQRDCNKSGHIGVPCKICRHK